MQKYQVSIKVLGVKHIIIHSLKQKTMKISQYNWNWWFVINLLLVIAAVIITLTAGDCKTQAETYYAYKVAAILWIVTTISMIPCLYIGMKPSED